MRKILYRDAWFRSYYDIVDDFGNNLRVRLTPDNHLMRQQWELAWGWVGGLGV